MNEYPPPMLCKVPEACRRLGIGRTKLYALRDAGEIEMVRIGGSALVPLDSLERFVERVRSVRPEVERLVELIDDSGMLDVSKIPSGTTLADLEAAKALAAGRKVPA